MKKVTFFENNPVHLLKCMIEYFDNMPKDFHFPYEVNL